MSNPRPATATSRLRSRNARFRLPLLAAIFLSLPAGAALESMDNWIEPTPTSAQHSPVPTGDGAATGEGPFLAIDVLTPLFAGLEQQYRGIMLDLPVPAAAWLFGSAVVGLSVVARRKRKTNDP